MTRYKLLAIDLDGTLVGADQRVSARDAEALRRAKAAGLAVCLCTGRSVGETRPVWDECGLPGLPDPLICAGGAIVSEPDTGRTLHIDPITPADATEVTEILLARGLCVAGLIDGWRWGFDYYLVEGGDSRTVWRDWFAKHPCEVRTASPTDLAGPAELLRIGALIDPDAGAKLQAELAEQFAGRLEVIQIFALNYRINVLEIFGHEVTKWAGVKYVAQGGPIASRDIVAVGDDVNDVPMFQRAGLGVAMGSAARQVQDAAKLVIGHNGQDPLPEFIDDLLAGRHD